MCIYDSVNERFVKEKIILRRISFERSWISRETGTDLSDRLGMNEPFWSAVVVLRTLFSIVSIVNSGGFSYLCRSVLA